MLWRLLHSLAPKDYLLAVSPGGPDLPTGPLPALPAHLYRLPPEPWLRGGRLLGESRTRRLNLRQRIWLRALRLARLSARVGRPPLVACTGDILDIPAAAAAARLTGVRFFPYVFDDYTHQWMDPLLKDLAGKWERRWFPRAGRVLVTNPLLAQELERRHGVRPAVVPNSCPVPTEPTPEELNWEDGRELVIMYTGMVYFDDISHFGPLLELLKSPECSLRLELYSGYDPGRQLGPRVHVSPPVPYEDIPALVRRADILFLPLSVTPGAEEVVRTAFSAKLADYLAGGRPIVAQVPGDCYTARLLRENRCGLVVDPGDVRGLALALESLRRDAGLRRELVANAIALAQGRFSSAQALAAFWEALSG